MFQYRHERKREPNSVCVYIYIYIYIYTYISEGGCGAQQAKSTLRRWLSMDECSCSLCVSNVITTVCFLQLVFTTVRLYGCAYALATVHPGES